MPRIQVGTNASRPKNDPPNQPAPSHQVPMPTQRAMARERRVRYRAALAVGKRG
jgi:hypothetical protein